MDCKKDSKRLKIIAHQMLETSNPEIKWAAIRMINALMIKRKSPSVSMVMGKVNTISMGLTKKLSTLNTNATIMAVVMESTPTPGSTYDRMITARAFNKSLRISFMIYSLG